MMETTVSSSPNNLFCLIRKEWVKHTPEEGVRQKTLSSLLTLGYPGSLIVVERKISQLPHLTQKPQLPNRRIDIVCYEAKSLRPLLVIECKARAISPNQWRQVLGYNFYIGAKLLAIANSQEVQLVDAYGNSLLLSDDLPSYEKLLSFP